MRFVRLTSPGNLQFSDEPIPAPSGNETLIRVKTAGVCGLDLHWFISGGIGLKIIINV